MADLGFWNFARRDPARLALVDPDGREWTRGELLASSNQVVHGLRALGLKKGDCVATVLPNGAPMIERNTETRIVGPSSGSVTCRKAWRRSAPSM